jgi:c-di-GMP-binding flagellar brake protein YcgR
MEQAFQSIARAFARHRPGLPAVEIAILILLAAAVALLLAGVARHWRAHRSLLRRFAARHALGEEDLAFVTGLARRLSVTALALLTHLDLFERATAQALAERRPAKGSGRGDAARRIQRIRSLLGFDRLPSHTPLLTTRELGPGIAVEVDGQQGQTFDVDESSFSLEVRSPLVLPANQTVELGLVHAREARYALRCQLLATHPGRGGTWCLVFAHDEAPTRIQLREYARVPARGSVAMRHLGPHLVQPGTARAEPSGELVNVSAGGMLVESCARLRVGTLLSVDFAVSGRPFAGLQAVVLSFEPAPDGRFHAHLEFRRVAEEERCRLVSAIATLELAQRGGSCTGA